MVDEAGGYNNTSQQEERGVERNDVKEIRDEKRSKEEQTVKEGLRGGFEVETRRDSR